MASLFFGLSGYPAAGKTELGKAFAEKGFEVVSASQLLRASAENDSFPTDVGRDGLMSYWKERAQYDGPDWLAQHCIRLRDKEGSNIVFDGVRILEDALAIKAVNGILVYMNVSPTTMLNRLAQRGRPDDQELASIRDIEMRRHIEDSGGLFRLGDIRELASIATLENSESDLGRTYSRTLASHLIELHLTQKLV